MTFSPFSPFVGRKHLPAASRKSLYCRWLSLGRKLTASQAREVLASGRPRLTRNRYRSAANMKATKTTMLHAFVIGALAGLALVVTPVSAGATFLDFTVVESVVPGTGTLATTFTADKINGAYSETLTVDTTTGTFTASGAVNFTQYLNTEGTNPVSSLLNVPPGTISQQYGLFAVFSFAGTVSPGTFTGTSGSVTVWLDPGLNTTKTLPATGSGSVTLGGTTSDDFQVLNASTLSAGSGTVSATDPSKGFFDLLFGDPALTTGDQNATTAGTQNGSLYWTGLPLMFAAIVDGDFVGLSSTSATSTLTGDVSAVFVPEPATLTLLGLGLVGVGAAARRRKARSNV